MSQSTALETVKRWAGNKLMVNIYEDVGIPSVSLFTYVSVPNERVRVYDLAQARWGLLYRHEDAKILGGEDALQAALDAGVDDPEDVARLALLFLQDQGDFTDDAGPAMFHGNVLIFYWRHSDMSRQLMKARSTGNHLLSRLNLYERPTDVKSRMRLFKSREVSGTLQ